MELDDRKKKAVELIVDGENISNIAKLVGVNRKTIYEWMKNTEFKAEVDRLVADAKNQAEKKIVKDIDLYISELKKIALTSKSEKNKLDALQYILNRIYGTPTSKVADVTNGEDKDNIDSNTLEQEFNKFKIIKKVN